MALRVVVLTDWFGVAERVAELDEVEIVDDLADADAVVCNRLTRDELRGVERLRLVQALSAGADSIDREALPPGCTLCNAYEHENAIAEWAVMSLLALTRHLRAYDRALRRGEWLRLPPHRELDGRTLGVLGYGHIARRTVELLRPFGMDAIAVTRSPDPARAEGLRRLDGLDGLDRLLAEADVLLVAVPLSPETENMIGRRQLDLLGADGYLLNPARGPIVEEQALYDALREGRIAGAALDTWWRYPDRRGEPTPPSALPFGELDNVVMTPHVSGSTEGTGAGRRELVAAQLLRLARGEPLVNVVAVGR